MTKDEFILVFIKKTYRAMTSPEPARAETIKPPFNTVKMARPFAFARIESGIIASIPS